jgi:AraC family transcriptional regulator, exoenzyme S synthesis regulatory protein ExsA
MINNYNLPADFLPSGNVILPKAFVYRYKADKNATKNRVILSTHLITFLTEGSKEIVMGNENVKLEKGHFALITSGKCFMSEKLSAGSSYNSTLLFFDNELLLSFRLAYQKKIDQILKSKPIQSKEILCFKSDAFTKAFAESLNHIPTKSDGLAQLKVQEILLYLLETYPEKICGLFADIQKSNEDFSFKNIIDSNIDSSLSVQELAFLCNVSLSTFKRKFTKIYNDAPTTWMRQKRMEHAAFLLAYNKERPSDIYLRLGYKNFSSFTQSFKMTFGRTPKEYQMKHLS